MNKLAGPQVGGGTPALTRTRVTEHVAEYLFRYNHGQFCSVGVSEEESSLSIKSNVGMFHIVLKVPDLMTMRSFLHILGAAELTDRIAHSPENTSLHPQVSAMYTIGAVKDQIRTDVVEKRLTTDEADELHYALGGNEPIWKYTEGRVIINPGNHNLKEYLETFDNPTHSFLRFGRPQAYHILRGYLTQFLEVLEVLEVLKEEADGFPLPVSEPTQESIQQPKPQPKLDDMF